MWLKLDDKFLRHPKILALSDAAKLAHLRALLYCSEFLTDGFIPLVVIRDEWKLPENVLAEVTKSLWRRAKYGFVVHDFLDWNPSRETVEKHRKANRDRQASRRDSLRDTPRDTQRESRRESQDPVLVPSYSRPREKKKNKDIVAPTSADKPLLTLQESDGLCPELSFDRVYGRYPRKTHRKDAKKAWNKLPLRDRRAAVAALPTHCEQWNGTQKQHIPHMATWLNGRRWEDDLSQGTTGSISDEETLRLVKERREKRARGEAV